MGDIFRGRVRKQPFKCALVVGRGYCQFLRLANLISLVVQPPGFYVSIFLFTFARLGVLCSHTVPAFCTIDKLHRASRHHI